MAYPITQSRPVPTVPPWRPTPQQIDAACVWWGQALGRHRFDLLGHHSATGVWLAYLAAARFRAPPDGIVQAYIRALRAALERTPSRRLIVDYRPEGVLADALAVAAIPAYWKLPTGLQFPRKMSMEFDLGGSTWVYYQSCACPVLIG